MMMAAAKTYPFKIKQIPGNRKLGKITKDRPHKREPHEEETARTLVRFGYDLQFIKPSNIPNSHTPDCLWRGEYWEMKAPKKNRGATVVATVKDALAQSQNVILDIARSRRNMQQVASDLSGYISSRPSTKIRKVFILNREYYCVIEKKMIV